MTGSFKIIRTEDDVTYNEIIKKIGKMMILGSDGKDYHCRVNTDTFELEAHIDGKWRTLDPVIDVMTLSKDFFELVIDK